MIYFLPITLLLLFFMWYKVNANEIVAPSSLFALSFLFSSIWALLYADNWSLKLSNRTFCVICGGVLIFGIASYLTSVIFQRLSFKDVQCLEMSNSSERTMLIEKWKIVALCLFQSVTIILSVLYIIRYYGGASVSSAIGYIRDSSEFSFPTLISLMRLVTMWAGYWMCYVISEEYVMRKKVDIVLIIPFALAIISTLLTGGRNQFINLVVAIIVIMFMLQKKAKKEQYRMKFFSLVKIAALVFIILFFFKQTLDLLGRTTRVDNTLDYIAMYCGAEIKNLDTFLKNFNSGSASGIWDSHTFDSLISWLGKYFGKESPGSINYFRFVNGYSLGNVYTTFYSFIYDFGFGGMVILTSLMAIISQSVYETARRVSISTVPRLSVVLYGYISSSLIMSFFSNKFYEQNFSVIFFRGIFVILILNLFFFKIKFKLK